MAVVGKCPVCGTQFQDTLPSVCPNCRLPEVDAFFVSGEDYLRWKSEVMEVHAREHSPKVFAGEGGALILLGNGNLYGMGNNDGGRYAANPELEGKKLDKPVFIASRIRSAAAGYNYSLMVDEAGKITFLGNSGVPYAERFQQTVPAREVYAASDCDVFWLRDENNSLYGWGNNLSEAIQKRNTTCHVTEHISIDIIAEKRLYNDVKYVTLSGPKVEGSFVSRLMPYISRVASLGYPSYYSHTQFPRYYYQIPTDSLYYCSSSYYYSAQYYSAGSASPYFPLSLGEILGVEFYAQLLRLNSPERSIYSKSYAGNRVFDYKMENNTEDTLDSYAWEDSFDSLEYTPADPYDGSCEWRKHEPTDSFQIEHRKQLFTLSMDLINAYLFEPVKIERDAYLPLSFQSGSGLVRAQDANSLDSYREGKKTIPYHGGAIHLTHDGTLRIIDEQGRALWSMEGVADCSEAKGILYVITFDRKLYRGNVDDLVKLPFVGFVGAIAFSLFGLPNRPFDGTKKLELIYQFD